MLLDVLGTGFGKYVSRQRSMYRAGNGEVSWTWFLINNLEIQKHYQSELCSRVFIQKIISKNLDEYKSIGTHWRTLFDNSNSMTYSASFAGEHKIKIKRFIDNKNFITNIFRTQAYDSMCG